MPTGPGKYDDLCTVAREAAKAQAVVLIVLNGKHGSGFSVQSHAPLTPSVLAETLSGLVEEVRASDDNARPMSTHQKAAYALLSIGKAAGALSHEDVRQDVIASAQRGELNLQYLVSLRDRLDAVLKAASANGLDITTKDAAA